jgi:hypothetical protein
MDPGRGGGGRLSGSAGGCHHEYVTVVVDHTTQRIVEESRI